jgi:hypothetical protein
MTIQCGQNSLGERDEWVLRLPATLRAALGIRGAAWRGCASVYLRLAVHRAEARGRRHAPLAVAEEIARVVLVEIVPAFRHRVRSRRKVRSRSEGRTDQCRAGLSLYLGLSASGTGAACCRASAAAMRPAWSSGGGTWSHAFWLQTSAASVRNLALGCGPCLRRRGGPEGRLVVVHVVHGARRLRDARRRRGRGHREEHRARLE